MFAFRDVPVAAVAVVDNVCLSMWLHRVALRARWDGACPCIIVAVIIEQARIAALYDTFTVGCRPSLSAALYVMASICTVLRRYCPLVVIAVFVEQARTAALYVMVCLSSFPTNFHQAPTIARVVNRLV
eukprot:CAMPEP_0203877808 /NCGR_PEP_ID=MMETSP0359-20131031/22380_1 /ASSEMBLY_ACC=CAM_ASM_000338 /TAXON_ID=268821 /ORGANISM="Scrippsiella Hangoei, Strain SHTV-5" /LENGTH=128 /DNA_ID=CAMNT_0050796851 /DNA_START=1061 /DNA_END=1447 /DNA_ORIENTATION=-